MFSRETQQTTLKPMIDQDGGATLRFGVPKAVSEIATVRQQLRLAESAGYLCAGLPGNRSVYILKGDTSHCLHASNTEGIPAGTPDPLNFEVYHQPLPDNNDQDGSLVFQRPWKWKVSHQSGVRPRTPCQQFALTGEGHKYLYTCAPANIDHAEEFSIVPIDLPDRFAFSGYFELASIRTGSARTYGSETTPAGRPRVYQDPTTGPHFTSIEK